MSQDNDNNNKDKKVKDAEKYTFDSSENVKEIMTGRSGEGEGEGTLYPDSDKHLVEDIKKVINNKEEDTKNEK